MARTGLAAGTISGMIAGKRSCPSAQISWNAYGESHHIGPLHEGGYELFRTGMAPFNYAENMPHDGWRTLLPFFIGMYKHGHAVVKAESLVAWYRTAPRAACGSGGSWAKTQSHAQFGFGPPQVVADRIFYSALYTEYARLKYHR
jgi:hypothetical protein